jgi:hypothetical protein
MATSMDPMIHREGFLYRVPQAVETVVVVVGDRWFDDGFRDMVEAVPGTDYDFGMICSQEEGPRMHQTDLIRYESKPHLVF